MCIRDSVQLLHGVILAGTFYGGANLDGLLLSPDVGLVGYQNTAILVGEGGGQVGSILIQSQLFAPAGRGSHVGGLGKENFFALAHGDSGIGERTGDIEAQKYLVAPPLQIHGGVNGGVLHIADIPDGIPVCLLYTSSDYAAVSLVGRLREKNYAIPEKLYVVGYGDMFLSRLFRPSITSISDDYESFGKAALAICAMMEKNDAFSVVSVKLKSRLHIRETTENRPYLPDSRPVVPVPIPENRFFGDMEFTKLANLETMFNECDETDFMLLHLLPQERCV